MTKNRTPTLVYLDPGMHPGIEVKGLNALSPSAQTADLITDRSVNPCPVTNKIMLQTVDRN